MFEYFFHNQWLGWFVFAIVCMIIELTSFDFFVTCFAIGAIGGMLGSFIGLPLWVQILLWAIVSVVSIFFIRPALTKRIHKKEKQRSSNADALVGKIGRVIDTIPADDYGYVKIDGDEWRSVSLDKQAIGVGTTVKVVSRDSIILTVEAI